MTTGHPHTVDPYADRPPLWCPVDVGCPKCKTGAGEPCHDLAPPKWHVERVTEMTRQAQITCSDWRAQRRALGLPVPGPGR
jgi:hypothetical protein